MTAPTNLDSKAVAAELKIDAKALRVFLRSGKADGMFSRDGKSYVFTKANVTAIKKAYPAWVAERAKAKADAKVTAEKADEPKAS